MTARVNGSGAGRESAVEVPDALGGDWVARTLTLDPDEIGDEPVATLVRRAGQPTSRRAALYVHGFTDYFFQVEHAQTWLDHGVDFYALDLRRNGRSLRPDQPAGDVRDLRTYGEEISRSLAILREDHDQVVLIGHSMGGLVTALFVHDHPGAVTALVLNNPWFGLNEPMILRAGGRAIAEVVTRVDPRRVVGRLRSDYGRALHASTGGTWTYDLAWKPLEGFPVRAGWLRAVLRGQARLFQGLAIDVPVLLCTSTRSGGIAGRKPVEAEILGTDIVLDVRDAWRGAQHLGADVTIHAIPGSVHDLALSAPRPRDDYVRAIFGWLDTRL